MNQTIIQVFGNYFLCLDKFPLGWWFQWYIIHAYSLQEKGLFEVKTDQNRTNLAKKSKKLLTLMLIVEVITDRIIWFLKILRIPNYSFFENERILNSTIWSQLFEYQILKKRIVAPQKILYVKFVTKWDEENLILYFHTYIRAFYCVFFTYLAYKKF